VFIRVGVMSSLVGPLPMAVRAYDIALAYLFDHLVPTARLMEHRWGELLLIRITVI